MTERMYHPDDVKLLVPHEGAMYAVPMHRVMIRLEPVTGRHLGYLVRLDLPGERTTDQGDTP